MTRAKINTGEALGIFWHGEEVPGLYFYAYASNIDASQPAFPMDCLPLASAVEEGRLFGEDWVVWMWSVRVEEWRGDWLRSMQATLTNLLESGGRVAWAATEACFSDPPSLFDPNAMPDCVYAAISQNTGFICHTDIDKPFKAITSSEMLALKAQLKSPS